MISVCLKKSYLKKVAGAIGGAGISLTLATSAFAQTASTESSSLSKGGTSSSLLDAGTTEITYAIFAIGVALFVLGAMKLVKSFR